MAEYDSAVVARGFVQSLERLLAKERVAVQPTAGKKAPGEEEKKKKEKKKASDATFDTQEFVLAADVN
eukprot:COSAG01_NODE_2770_length_7102_cov_5.735399_12_plen_68_part_00